jgi:mono/diheme cytochrome c family protein
LDKQRMKSETLARLFLALFILAAVAVPLGARWLSLRSHPAVLNLQASMPENGGWSQTNLQAVAGQPLRLRLTSSDVVHSFAVARTDLPALELLPGEVVETTLTFDRPGKYTFYCSRWCGPNHWRMRGIIEVTAAVTGRPDPLPMDPQPLYLRLGIDLDAPHPASVTPAALPIAARGEQFASLLPADASSEETYRSTSPADLWQSLRSEGTLAHLSESSLWDIVAWVWSAQTSPDALATGAVLYAQNCAACHGESGKGDGVMVHDLPVWNPADHASGEMAHGNLEEGLVRPPDFSNPAQLLGASPALLEGKIIRGGMGTGMPYWGPIFTPEQIDALVSYLYTFVLEPVDKLNFEK